MKRWFLKNEVWVFLTPILCLGFAWLIRDTVLVDRLEWRTLDWRTQKRAELGQVGPDPRILVIGIENRSSNNIEPWPFRRAYHGQLQDLLSYGEPAVVT